MQHLATRHRTLMFLAVLALALATGTQIWGQARREGPIKIGYIDSLTGIFAFSGTHGRQGAILATEEINAKGGVLGRSLELVIRDDKSRPADGAAAMRDLVDNGIVIGTGGINSAAVAAVSEVARETKTPFLAKAGYAAFLTEAASHRYFFRVSTSARVIAAATASELARRPYRKICTVGFD